MTIQISPTFANALLTHDATAAQSAVIDQIVGGSLVIYNGTEPATAATALSGNTALATFALDSTVADYGAASGGVQPLKFGSNLTTPTVTAAATGTASFFRILSSGSTSLIQGTVGTSGSDFNLTSNIITALDNVSITGTPSIALPVT